MERDKGKKIGDIIFDGEKKQAKDFCEEFDIPFADYDPWQGLNYGFTKYEDPEAVARVVKSWMWKCLFRKHSRWMEGVKIKEADPQPLTVSGLTNALGVSSVWLKDHLTREAIKKDASNYTPNVEAICDVIERAYNFILEDHETRLAHKNTTNPGLVTILKNRFGWTDKSELDLMSGGKAMAPVMYLPKMDEDPDEKKV